MEDLKEIADSPAYPSESNSEFCPGMTLREYFAAQAMHGLLSANRSPIVPGGSFAQPRQIKDAETIAAKAVEQADALIKALHSK